MTKTTSIRIPSAQLPDVQIFVKHEEIAVINRVEGYALHALAVSKPEDSPYCTFYFVLLKNEDASQDRQKTYRLFIGRIDSLLEADIDSWWCTSPDTRKDVEFDYHIRAFFRSGHVNMAFDEGVKDQTISCSNRSEFHKGYLDPIDVTDTKEDITS